MSRRLSTPVPAWFPLFLAGLCASYAVQPLIHHTLGTDGYFYLSTWDNFFADSVPIQLGVWALGAACCAGAPPCGDAWIGRGRTGQPALGRAHREGR